MVSAICLLVFWSDLANSILVEVRSLIELNSKQPYVKSKLHGSVGHMLNQSIQDTHGAEGASITIGLHDNWRNVAKRSQQDTAMRPRGRYYLAS